MRYPLRGLESQPSVLPRPSVITVASLPRARTYQGRPWLMQCHGEGRLPYEERCLAHALTSTLPQGVNLSRPGKVLVATRKPYRGHAAAVDMKSSGHDADWTAKIGMGHVTLPRHLLMHSFGVVSALPALHGCKTNCTTATTTPGGAHSPTSSSSMRSKQLYGLKRDHAAGRC